MSESEEKSPQGRPWKVVGTFASYENAKRKADELAGDGVEAKVKLKSEGFTVRMRAQEVSPETKPSKSRNKEKKA